MDSHLAAAGPRVPPIVERALPQAAFALLYHVKALPPTTAIVLSEQHCTFLGYFDPDNKFNVVKMNSFRVDVTDA